MKGIIVLWSGAIVDIPAGWGLCDGTNGTPDLRDRFVIGAGGTYAVGDTGGSDTHTHDFTANSHNHTLAAGAVIAGGPNYSLNTSSVQVTGTTQTGWSLPPFYALAFIMKL